MSGVEDAILESTGSRSETRDSGGTLINGIFYGAISYLVGYVWVYVNILSDDIPNRAAESVLGTEASELTQEELAQLQMLIPGTGEYAGWVYHYAMGGSIGVSMNLLPGTMAIDESFIYPFTSGAQSQLRETVLSEPWMLLHPSEAWYYVEVVQGPSEFAALSFVAITPTALFFAGFFLAYRHKELTPIGGALAGSKVTAGFLLASIATTYAFTVTISGFSVGGSGAISLEQLIGVEAGLSGGIEPVIEIGPSMTRAILIGIVYPLAFGTLGGAAAISVSIVRLPARAVNHLLSRWS